MDWLVIGSEESLDNNFYSGRFRNRTVKDKFLLSSVDSNDGFIEKQN